MKVFFFNESYHYAHAIIYASSSSNETCKSVFISMYNIHVVSQNNVFVYGYISSLYYWQMSLLGYLTHLDSCIGMDHVQLKGDVGSAVESPP